MSIPISQCRIYRLAREGTDEEVKKFASDMGYNKRRGVWTQLPCRCEPHCVIPTDEQLKVFEGKVNDCMANERAILLRGGSLALRHHDIPIPGGIVHL